MQADESPEDRLEAALERIALIVETPDKTVRDVVARLDRLITTVRAALGEAPRD